MRSLHGVYYQIEATKPPQVAIKFGPRGTGWPLCTRQQDLSPLTQILLDWMTEAGVLAEFEELFQGKDQIKASEISDWWDDSEVDTRSDSDETSIQPTGKTKEVLRDHPA